MLLSPSPEGGGSARIARQGGEVRTPAAPSPPMLQRHWRRRRRSINRDVDRFHDAVDILGDVVVPESKHAISLFLQPRHTNAIVRLISILAMLRTIDFNQQPRRHAPEIRDIRSNRYLTAEVRPIEIELPQMMPKLLFGICCRAAKASRSEVSRV